MRREDCDTMNTKKEALHTIFFFSSWEKQPSYLDTIVQYNGATKVL